MNGPQPPSMKQWFSFHRHYSIFIIFFFHFFRLLTISYSFYYANERSRISSCKNPIIRHNVESLISFHEFNDSLFLNRLMENKTSPFHETNGQLVNKLSALYYLFISSYSLDISAAKNRSRRHSSINRPNAIPHSRAFLYLECLVRLCFKFFNNSTSLDVISFILMIFQLAFTF